LKTSLIGICLLIVVLLLSESSYAQLRGRAARRATAQLPASAESLTQWTDYLNRLRPAQVSSYAKLPLADFQKGASAVEYWAAQLSRYEGAERPEQALAIAERLLQAKAAIDLQLEQVLAQRTAFAALPADDARHAAMRHYLRATSALIDLSGRLRYLLFDALNHAADLTVERPASYEALLDLMLQYKSGVGAAVMANGLFDPPPNNPHGSIPVPGPAKFKILRLIAETGQYELLGDLATFIRTPNQPPRTVLAAVDAVRQLGIPQDPRPDQDPTLPKPPITAQELHKIVSNLDDRRLSQEDRRAKAAQIKWLEEARKSGITNGTYQLGHSQIQPGDWLLMRNPSPYNLFTDLSPGLFTHVGIATLEKGSDGITRMVIVDIPERGPKMPATNVDAFVDRTRHFVFLRHPDAEVAKKMAEAARDTIGNISEFDLNFQTDRILPLKGVSLVGKKVHTYCAGFLYLCALQTGLPREAFFPIRETPAAGATRENLKKFGFSMGEELISPTGALFAPQMQLIGQRDPMYDPVREIEEAVFDHFANRLIDSEVQPAPDAFQTMRQKVAEASKSNPLLAKALANAAGVAEEMDLVAAAKAKALVETLDEIAYGASGEYAVAREAILTGIDPESAKTQTAEQRETNTKYRQRHPELTRMMEQNQLSPRALRIELVRYYIAAGKRAMDERFFESVPPAKTDADAPAAAKDSGTGNAGSSTTNGAEKTKAN